MDPASSLPAVLDRVFRRLESRHARLPARSSNVKLSLPSFVRLTGVEALIPTAVSEVPVIDQRPRSLQRVLAIQVAGQVGNKYYYENVYS